MSVARAVGSAVFFPDFSFQQVLGTASVRPLQEDWGDFARPPCTIPDSVVVLVRVAKRIGICIIRPVFCLFLLY